MKTIIVKNVDTVDHTYFGQVIEDGGQYTVQTEAERVGFVEDAVFNQHLWADPAKVVVNNGEEDLSPIKADAYIKETVTKLNLEGVPVFDVSTSLGVTGSYNFNTSSHDVSDRTTWYQNSVQIVDEVLSTSDDLEYSASKTSWIDIYSKKLTYPYKRVLKKDGTWGARADWKVTVKVDDVVTEPDDQANGYTVNFVDGKIDFTSAQTGKVVKATFWHNDGVANASDFVIQAPAGETYHIQKVELQFSKGVNFDTSMRFEIWAGGTVAAYSNYSDVLFDAGYGQRRHVYRGLRDLINEGNEGKGEIPPAADLTQSTLIFPFDTYAKKNVPVHTTQATGTILLRVCNEGDVPMSGAEIATATFYIESIPQPV